MFTFNINNHIKYADFSVSKTMHAEKFTLSDFLLRILKKSVVLLKSLFTESGYRIMDITSVFKADNAGLIPADPRQLIQHIIQ
ncbi:Uncharacterised protein [Yersinia kristensenii]|nr:Uncharacterised protein [Yersinia kristensenii]